MSRSRNSLVALTALTALTALSSALIAWPILTRVRASGEPTTVTAIAATAQAQAVDSVPFELDDTRIYVPVSDSTGPLGWFILDTGAQSSGVDLAIADRWGAKAVDSAMASGAGSGRTMNRTIPGREIRVGSVPFHPSTLTAAAYDTLLGAVSGRVVSGIIGSAFFYQHTVTIDFDRRQLYLRPHGALGPVAKAVELPFTLPSDVPHVRGTLRLPGARVIPVDYLLDLGAKSTVLFAEPFLERQHVRETLNGPSFVAPLGAGIGGRTHYRFTRVPEVTLGPTGSDLTRWTDLVVGLSVDGTIRATYFDALFGLDMLMRFRPTLDYATKRLILEPRANAPASSEIDLSGLFLVEERRPRTMRVSAVVEQSPAREVAIEVGDELVALDGKPMSDYTLSQVREILRSWPGRRVELRVRRGGRTITQVLTLRRMA